MLKHTFCHITGIGEKTEAKLWSSGFLSHEEYGTKCLSQPNTPKRNSIVKQLMLSQESLEQRNIHYFASQLESKQMWRLYWDYRDDCAFVDIETTGFLNPEITTIVLFDGKTIRHYVNGVNLEQFTSDIQAYSLLVSYCGKSFDVPTIKRYFKIEMPHAHIDLVSPLRSIGLVGGLKGCEQKFGINRNGLDSVEGSIAPQLWNEYKHKNNPKALETLLAYNVHDTLSLHQFVVHLHNEKLNSTPFSELYALPLPKRPANPFKADQSTISRIMAEQMEISWALPFGYTVASIAL